MQDRTEELPREEEPMDWQEGWFDIPGDVDDFIFYDRDEWEERSVR